MKKILSFLSLQFIALSIFAQTVISVAGYQAYAWIPANFSSTTIYPGAIFFPGLGETNGGLPALKVHGFGLYASALADSAFPIILISVQPQSPYGIANANVQAIINAVRALYPNMGKLYGSGLSLGGGEWQNFIWGGESNFKQLAGVFLFSSETPTCPPYGTAVVTPSYFLTDSSFYYGGVGTADAFYNSLPNSMLAEYTGIKAQSPYYTPYLDTWSGIGHGDPVWSNGYNPAWKSPTMGMSIYRKIMQLAPAYSKSPPPVTPVVPVPPVTPPVTTPKTIKSILVTYSDGSTLSLP